MPDHHRAKAHLIAAGQAYEGIWRQLDEARHYQGSWSWPDHIFLPTEIMSLELIGWYIKHRRYPKEGAYTYREASFLAGLNTWRVTQGIYRFDADLYKALVDTPISGRIPSEVLFQLPEWCVYLETPSLSLPVIEGDPIQIRGAWAWMDLAPELKTPVLALMLDLYDESPTLEIAHIPLLETIEDSLDLVEAEQKERGPLECPRDQIATVFAALMPILSLVLYLCSTDADLGRPRSPRPTPTKTKRGLRYFPPSQPRTWEVGVRIGAALRRAQEAEASARGPATGTHARPRAHIRRAHWHTYRIGQGRQDRRLKWIPPIPINVEDLDQLPATIHPVV